MAFLCAVGLILFFILLQFGATPQAAQPQGDFLPLALLSAAGVVALGLSFRVLLPGRLALQD